MLAIVLAMGLLSNACPLKIGIARDGAVFSSRMQGWYRTSEKTLAGVLRAGCYNDANPSEISSVTLEIDSNAQKERVDQILSLLEKAGWPKNKIKMEKWNNDPQEPR